MHPMQARIAGTSGIAVMLGLLAVTPVAAAPVIFSVGGDTTPASIQSTVDNFRTVLGDPNNGNAPGPLSTGRREINWDGGGATTATPSGTPFAGFQNIRGALFTTPGTGFLQTPLDAPELLSINPTYATTFNFFSPLRIFTPVGSNITDATFSIPGTAGGTAASVSGFGAVFSNVNLADATTLAFFDPNGNLLTEQAVPLATAAGGLSFLGVFFNAGEEIGRVAITTGTTALGPNDDPAAGVNVVVMDDFIYGEPQALAAVPEPASLSLLGVCLAGLGLLRRRRGRPSES